MVGKFLDRPFRSEPIQRLCRLYGGLGFSSLSVVLSRLGVPFRLPIDRFPPERRQNLEFLIRSRRSGRSLRRFQLSSIQEKQRLGSYQGLRHGQRLPVRGQRTHSNGRTVRRFHAVVG